MAIRKLRRVRQSVKTIEEYGLREGTYFLTHKGCVSAAEFHSQAFFSEADERNFYQEHHEIFNTMRTDRNCRDQFYQLYHKPGERHFLWWKYDSPEARDETILEYFQLKEMNTLKPEEIEALKNRAIEENQELHSSPWHNGLPFRRSWLFWEFISPEPQDTGQYDNESRQLIRLGVLTCWEKEILADPSVTLRPNASHRTRFYYMDRVERRQLGLDSGHDPAIEKILERSEL